MAVTGDPPHLQLLANWSVVSRWVPNGPRCKTPSKLPLHSAENLHHKASAKAGLRALVTAARAESQDECALMPSWQSWVFRVFLWPWACSMDFGVSKILTNKYGASKECPHPPSTFDSHGLPQTWRYHPSNHHFLDLATVLDDTLWFHLGHQLGLPDTWHGSCTILTQAYFGREDSMRTQGLF